jgi:uncharacterized protein (DUF952 family)/purine-nucleoside phosphorylase
MNFLYHLTDWPHHGLDQPASLATEGFVHLSSDQQLLRTAQRWFGDRTEVGVLVLDKEALGEALRWEDLYDHGEAFPHLYSELPEAAVAAVVKMVRGPDGHFRWPAALAARSPLLEGPDQGVALIEPTHRFPNQVLPPIALLCCFPRIVNRLAETPGSVQVHHGLGSAIGPDPVVVLERGDRRFAVCCPGVGGPTAAVALEELIALGCSRFVMCGGAGSLRSEQALGQVVLVDVAVRDEGLSHHYLPAASDVLTAPWALEQASAILARIGVDHQVGATWSTDALYRETPARIARRKAQGCLTVEMEVASLLAVAQFRQVPLVPMLFCGDDLGGEAWDFRDWTSADTVWDKLFWAATEVALGLRDSQEEPSL